MASSPRIDELQKKFEENPRRYFAPLANEYRKAGELEQAILICQEYLPQQPGHMSGHIVYGQALYELGRHEEAKAVFETALSLDPENLIALKHLGDIARNAGDTKGARVWYQRVLEADPRNEEIAQIMLSLLSLPEGTPAIGIPVMPAHAEEPPEIPDLREAFIGREPTPARSATPIATSLVELTVAPPPPPPTPPETMAASAAASAADPEAPELLDIEDFHLGSSSAAPTAEMSETTDEMPVGGAVGSADAQSVSAYSTGADETADDDEFALPSSNDESMDHESLDLQMAETADLSLDTFGLTGDDESESNQEHDGKADDDRNADTMETPIAAGFEATRFDGLTLDTPGDRIDLDEPPAIDAEAARDAEPLIEMATDMRLGLVDGSETGADGVSAEAVLDGLESFEEGTVVGDESALAGERALSMGSYFDSSGDMPAAPAASMKEEAYQFSNAPGTPDTGGPTGEPAFVTETMAELYLEQGHLESALIIYRTLVDQRPEDAHLRDRMRIIEDRVYGRRDERSVPVTPRPTPARLPSVGGDEAPTIREFLTQLLSNGERFSFPSTWSTTPLAAPAIGMNDVATPSSNGAFEPGHERAGFPPGEPRAPSAAASDTVSGSIGALFSGADSSHGTGSGSSAIASGGISERSAIESAVSPDAEASPSEPEAIAGAPARRASDELSLDHVFKANAPPRQSGEGESFSFSQFFAEEAKPAAPANQSGTSAGPPPAPESTDDITQFNAWLDGLKKKT